MRARRDDTGELELAEAASYLSGLNDLLWAVGIGSSAGWISEALGDPGTIAVLTGHPRPGRQAMGIAYMEMTPTRIQRISYNSPLEVVLLVSGIAGTATLLAQRVVSIFADYQRARVTTAEADLRVAALNLLHRDLVSAGFPREDLTKADIDRTLASASRALALTSSLELVEDDTPGR